MKRTLKKTLSTVLVFTMILSTCFFAGMPGLIIKSHAAIPDGALSAHEDGSFKILQVADVQSTYPVPDQWLNALRLSIATAQPDLIVMTGDNVYNSNDYNSFKNTVDQIVAEFYTLVTTKTGEGSSATYSTEEIPIPFAVTFGNHDYESNANLSIDTQWNYYLSKGALDFQKSYNNVTFAKGTGYIDVYNAEGTAIVQRVIILNSGSKQNGGYARPGCFQHNNVDFYEHVVSAVDNWTSDANIKCIGFQHIPMQELYLGDSASTSILKPVASTAQGAIPAYSTANTSISGSYAPSTENPTVTGQYTEMCCCSYNSTRDLYNAYAKDNVYGVFYGHDHGNLINGVTTIGGKKLRQGYGGGLNTEWNGSGTSLFSHYDLNSAYTGPDDTANFKKEGFSYANYLEQLGGVYGPKTYTPEGLNYVTELWAERSGLEVIWGFEQANTFERAYKNVLEKADYAIETMANDSGANADMNKGCGDNSYYVALGYKLTPDRTKAVTGIIGMQVTGTHPSQITVYLQDNTPITYYLEDNNCNCAAGTGVTNLIYYTTDPKAGPPITDIYMTYENGQNLWGHYGRDASEYTEHGAECSSIFKPYKVSFTVEEKQGEANAYEMQDWNTFDFNRGCGEDTPYIYVVYGSNGTDDVTRPYYDLLVAFNKYGQVQDSLHQVYDSLTYDPYDSYRNNVDEFLNNPTTGVSKTPYSEQPYEQINKMTKVLVDAYNALKFKDTNNGRQVKSEEPQYTDFYVAVPDTIYLTPGNSGEVQYFCNNKIDTNGEIIPDGTYSSTGTFEIVCKDAYDVQIAVRRMKPQSSGQRFQFSENKSGPCYYPFNTTSGHPNNLYVTAQSTAADHGEFISGAPDGDSYSISGGDGGEGHESFPKMKPAVRSDGTEYIKGSITKFSMESNQLAAGDRQMLEWQFTITRGNGTIAEVYAYSTMYAPFVGTSSVAASMSCVGLYLVWYSAPHITGTYWIAGGHSVTSEAMSADSNKELHEDEYSFYTNPLISGATVITGGETDGKKGTTDYPSGMVNGKGMYAAGNNNGNGSSGQHVDVHGGTMNISVDTSRYNNYNQIPNLKIGYDINLQDEYSMRSDDSSMTNSYQYSTSDTTKTKPIDIFTQGGRQSSPIEGSIVSSHEFYANAGARYSGYNIHIKNWVTLKTTTLDKSIIRKAVGKYESLSPQKEWLRDEVADSVFSTYMNALVNASYALGDPTYYDVALNVSTNYTTPLSAAFSAMGGANQKRSCVIDGVTVPFFTTEINYGLTGNLDGFGHRSDYTVAPVIYDLYKYQGKPGDNPEGDGIYALNTVTVQPYDLCADMHYNYLGWMDGDGFRQRFAVDSAHWSGITEGFLPQAGDIVTDNMLLNFYTHFDGVTDSVGKHPTATPVNYGHITAETIIDKLNLFHFYYKKTDHTLTFDVGAGQFTYSDGTTKTGTQYSTVAAEDDSFRIGFAPTRDGYLFDGWEITSGDGNYDSLTNTYTFGTSDAVLKAIWVKQSWLYIDSDGGYTRNNLIYFSEARDTFEGGNDNMTYKLSYEDDSDVTITGKRTNKGSGETTANPVAYVYLEYGKSYTFEFYSTNNQTDFYVFAPSGNHCNFKSGAQVWEGYGEGGQHIAKTVTVGTNLGDSSWGNSGVNTSQLTGVYSIRLDQDAYVSESNGEFTVSNMRITEANPNTELTDIDDAQRGWDNKIYQLESRTRIIPNPDDRPDGYIFGGWEVYEMNGESFGDIIANTMDHPDLLTNIIYENTTGGCSFTYQNRDIGLKVMWIKPIGVALDNMFNFYKFRYNSVSRVLNGAGKTNGDTVIFDNVNQKIRVRDDGTGTGDGTNYDVYTSHSAGCYDMPLFVDKDGNKVRTYLFTMDITVTRGKGQYFVFGQQGDANKTNSSSWILTSEYPSSSKHICTVITAADDTEYLSVRFGFNAQNSDVTYSNIRIVPVNSVNTTDTSDPCYMAKGSSIKYADSSENKAKINLIIDEDTLGYAYDNNEALNEAHRIAPKINPVTVTYNLLEKEYLGSDLYRPTRYGYSFIGWVKDGLYVADPNDQESYFLRETPITTDVNIWSRWSADEFILKYDANTDDTVDSMPVNAAPTGDETAFTWTLIFDSATKAASDDIISKAVPVNSDAPDTLFMGWCTVADPSDEEPGEMFYPGGDLPRKTVDALYGKKDGDNNVLTLYAQWYDTEPAKDDAERNEEGKDLHQLTTNIVRGISIDADGKYKETLYEMKNSEKVVLSKYDVDTHGVYSSAIDTLNNAFGVYNTANGAMSKTVTADTTANIKEACAAVIDAAAELTVDTLNDVIPDYAADNDDHSFIIQDSTGKETEYTLAEMNLNHYTTATLTDASTAKSNAVTAAYSEGSTLRKAFDDVEIVDLTAETGSTTKSAQIALNESVESMAKDFVNKQDIGVDPMFKVYETPDKVAEALGSNDDIEAVHYVTKGSEGSAYTYYCYTHSPTPTIVIDIDEIEKDNRVCYPTTASLISKNNGKVDIESETIDNTTYKDYLENGLGTVMTDSNEDYYNQKQVVKIQPTFTGDNAKPRTTATYTLQAYDDSYVANDGKNYATLSALSGDKIKNNEEITINDTTNNQITIVINYKADEGFNVTGSQWEDGVDKYLGQYHLWRTSGGANNWEIHGKNDASASIYTVYDDEYQQLNYCSFFYVFNVGSADNNNTCTIKSTNLTDVHNFIKNNFDSGLKPFTNTIAKNGTGLGYMSWSGSDGWAPNLYPQSNSYVYVHVIDRWGNLVDKVLGIGNLDPQKPTLNNTSVGSVLLEESGGSGIATASLNANSIQIITDDDSTLADNVYRTTGNTVKLYTGEPNKSYTLNVNDKAANAATATVKTDSEGYLVITVEDEDYTYDGAYTFTLGSFEINLYDGIIKHIKKVENGEAYVGEKATATIITSDEATMAQLKDEGGTSTATTYVDNGNGTRTWTVSLKGAEGVHEFTVRAKVNGKWIDEGKTATLTYTKKPEPTIGEVVSVDYTPSTSAKNTFKVTVTGNPDYIQFTYPDGGTDTFTKDRAEIEGDVWTVKATLPAGDYSARARYNGKWCEKTAFSVVLLEKDVPDANVYSIEIEGQDGNILKSGKHEVTVVTGKAVTKLMLKNTVTGSTNTYTADNAKIEEVEGKLVWKFTKNFLTGTDTTYNVKIRTETSTSFADSGKSIDVVVTY